MGAARVIIANATQLTDAEMQSIGGNCAGEDRPAHMEHVAAHPGFDA
jgi:hypothetical protein